MSRKGFVQPYKGQVYVNSKLFLRTYSSPPQLLLQRKIKNPFLNHEKFKGSVLNVKINDILDLTHQQGENLASVAKRIDGIGEKRLRNALKAVSCKPRGSGKKGWEYVGDDQSLLEKDIFDVIPKASNSDSSIDSKSNSKKKSEASASKAKASDSLSQVSASVVEDSNHEGDSIDRLLSQQERSRDNKTYRGFYMDDDVSKVIDSVGRGSKSELVNEALRKVFKEKGLL